MYARVTRPFVLCARGLVQWSGDARLNDGRIKNVMIVYKQEMMEYIINIS